MARLLPFLVLSALLTAGCSGTTGSSSSISSAATTMATTAAVSASSSSSPSSSPPPSSSSSSSSTTGPAPTGPQTLQKTIEDNNFPGATFTLHVGDKVVWTDNGGNPHSVTADDGSFDSSPNCSSLTSNVPGECLAKGDTFPVAFGKAGSVKYHCRIHSSMVGTITVQ